MKKPFTVFIALLLTITLTLPSFAGEAEYRHNTPAGYNDHDYQKMAAFLDIQTTVTVYGMTMTKHNYEWLQMIDPSFSMQDPSTWHVDYNGTTQFYVEWTSVGGEQRLLTVWADPSVPSFSDYSSGDLDLSGCEELITLVFNYFRLGALDVSDCGKLTEVECRDNNSLASVNLSGCISLASLNLMGCALTELDVSDCTELAELACTGSQLTELDLSNCPLLPFDMISANGYGTVGYAEGSAHAVPNSGKEFLGWYSEGGAFISSQNVLNADGTDFTRVSARFTGYTDVSVPGDADGDGSVTVSDALIVLRGAMGLIELTPEQSATCDMDGSGAIDISDALTVLRIAMGLI